ncbi:hypothetical protein [Holdemania sp. Marseille-P2844]|uniref:hypothetical protein n=1 Tax=Holdemania sp. Marseille-P2844 TaxID=1852366 RepID=UPI00135645BA|nr:hypothetical protein [Holdemania sp. Marseille-P2844]
MGGTKLKNEPFFNFQTGFLTQNPLAAVLNKHHPGLDLIQNFRTKSKAGIFASEA